MQLEPDSENGSWETGLTGSSREKEGTALALLACMHRLTVTISVLPALSMLACVAEAPFGGFDDERADTLSVSSGRDALLNEGYIGTGVTPELTWIAPDGPTLPGRSPANEDLPYFLNRFSTENGELVGFNCLFCHAAQLDGELVVGLGTSTWDFTRYGAGMVPFDQPAVLDAISLVSWGETGRFIERVKGMDHIQTRVIGANVAHDMAWALASRRNPETFAWLEEPTWEAPSEPIPVDVPPWWNVGKKTGLYYSQSGQGDRAQLLTQQTLLGLEEIDQAEQLTETFEDIVAFIESIEAPRYPYSIDAEAASRGEAVYAQNCRDCHGDTNSYPNRLVSLDQVDTDPLLAEAYLDPQHPAARYFDWVEQSPAFSSVSPSPQRGYVAPPLDGIWATAPYLHNGSVPTLGALFDSSSRPTRWTRSFDPTFPASDYDTKEVGWRYQKVESSEADPRVYDTTFPGYRNTGHTFGDDLSDESRDDLIEYLKTL